MKERYLQIFCSCWFEEKKISWLWQAVFIGMVMCYGEMMVMCSEGH